MPSRSPSAAPHLARIALFPIKSLDGMVVERARFAPGSGLVHDRAFAIFDETGRIVNGKRDARVHAIRAEYAPDLESVRIGVGASREWFSLRDRRPLEAWLSSYFEMPVTVRADAESGFPDDTQAPGPTVISTATLAEVASWYGSMTLDSARRRFRANLEIGGVPAFWEDRLYGEPGEPIPFTVGAAMLAGTNPCQRCVVPSRDQETGATIDAFSKTFAERREERLPPWAHRSRFNHYYRLAINTVTMPQTIGATIAILDRVEVATQVSEPLG